MSRIATCTSCQRQVAIPDGVAPGESVRCPHCEAEYALIAVLLEAVDSDDASEPPPELVPVVAGAEPDEAERPPERTDQVAADEQPEQDADDDATEGAGQLDSTSPAPAHSEAEELAAGTDEPEPDQGESVGEVEEGEEAEEQVEAPGDEGAETVEPSGEEAAETADEESDEAAVKSEGRAHEEQPAEEAPGAEDETAEEEAVREAPAPQAPAEADRETGVAVRCPHCEAEYPLCEVIVVSTGEELGLGAAAAAARVALGGEEAGPVVAGLDVWAKVDAMPQIDLGQGAGPQAVTAAAAAFDFPKEDAEGEPGPEGKPRPRRRRKQKSGFRVLVGPVLGGLGGVLIAYYLLNWIRPESGNFLKIPLPGIPHTYEYSPDWFPGFLKPAAESEDVVPDELGDFQLPDSPPRTGEEEQAPAPREEKEPSNETPATDSSGFGAAIPEPPKRETLPDDYVGLVEPPSYSSDELGEALKAAGEGLEDPAGEISEEAYRTMCRLAEVMTFVDSSSGARAAGSRRSAVRKLLQQIGANPTNLDKIGYQAGALCARQDRQGKGILLAGTVAKLASEGRARGAHVQLAASGKPVLVVGKQPLPAKEDDSVLILGSIVDDPAENLVGFKTQQPFVIWAGLTVKIEE